MVVKLVLSKLTGILHIKKPDRLGGDCYCGFPDNGFPFIVDTKVFVKDAGIGVWHRNKEICQECYIKIESKFSLED
jgi:hypothetical protein